ncbi:hypothetical protein BVG16_21935 [Paenibacillus selenitireducens]|uniref:Xylose isomerase-like TIM barrel domain-containing protein n=1 Tax=Paenibacillus selenitireducens TaxID=1324314 RepID=A0A1T2X5T6_9BACL|nr:hypothetical protein [Paenibacillus selenitireducens]OPA75261.1 hypothetical protein BVG16_21935 [Paenibacillus selenitireducens]
MVRYMIGQYGGFDVAKYRRDFKEGFHGIEACLFSTEEDIVLLREESKRRGYHIGVHFPFRAGQSRFRDALSLSQDDEIRSHAYQLMENELAYLAQVEPDYVLFHYPKPVILDDRVDWKSWRFDDPIEYRYESQITFEELSEKSEYLFQWLTDRSDTYHFIPILEFDALNRYIYDTDLVVNLLHRYPKIKLCLDTARLHLQAMIDPNFDAKFILKKYAKYAELIHLSNAQVLDGTVQQRHYPVLPELNPAEGWAPIQDYLQLIFEENKQVRILFEHRSDLIGDEELLRCYAWVDELFTKHAL